MEMPDFSEMAKAQVAEERYEVVLRSSGFAVILEGAEKGTGSICTFPNRDGRQHLQKARAELCARAPELLAREKDLVDVIRRLRSCLEALVGEARVSELQKMKDALKSLPITEDKDVIMSIDAIDALIETSILEWSNEGCD